MGKKPDKIVMDRIHVRAIRGPHKNGSGRWYWRAEAYHNGDGDTLWTGWATREEAVQAAAGLLAEGKHHPKKPAPAPAPIEVRTVYDLCDVWLPAMETLAAAKEIRETTLKGYRQAAERLLFDKRGAPKRGKERIAHWKRRIIADVVIADLSSVDTEDYRNSRLLEPAAPRTVVIDLKILSFAWNWGRKRKLCPDRDFPMPKIRSKRRVNCHRTPTEDEAARVLEYLQGWPEIAALLYWGSGCRPGEISSLEWGMVRWLPGGMSLLNVTGKRGERQVYLSDVITARLRAWWEKKGRPSAGYVLTIKPTSFSARFNTYHLARACKLAGIDYFNAGGFRRAADERFARMRASPRLWVEQMNHSIQRATEDYLQATDEEKRQAAEILGDLPRRQVLTFPPADQGSPAQPDPHNLPHTSPASPAQPPAIPVPRSVAGAG